MTILNHKQFIGKFSQALPGVWCFEPNSLKKKSEFCPASWPNLLDFFNFLANCKFQNENFVDRTKPNQPPCKKIKAIWKFFLCVFYSMYFLPLGKIYNNDKFDEAWIKVDTCTPWQPHQPHANQQVYRGAGGWRHGGITI